MVPDEWREGIVQDFLFLQRGFDLTQKSAIDGAIPVYSSSGIAYYHNEAKVKGPGIVTGRKGSVGPVYLIEEDFWPHDTTLWVRDFKGNCVKYIEYFLKFLRLERFDEASSVPTLNRNNVHGVRCVFPPLKEQKKITQILSTWDKAIATTEHLLANSQQQKKALMQQLLTGNKRLLDNNGVRFSGEWNHGHLSDLGKITKGKALSSKDLIDGDYPVIAGGKSSPYNHRDFTHENAITVSASGAYAGYVAYHPYKLWASDCSVVTGKPNSNIGFIYQLMSHMQSKIYSLQSGGAQPHVYPKDLEVLRVSIPPIDEQKKIAAVLSTADQEISALQQKLDALKQEKKALMQQLLTGKRRVPLN